MPWICSCIILDRRVIIQRSLQIRRNRNMKSCMKLNQLHQRFSIANDSVKSDVRFRKIIVNKTIIRRIIKNFHPEAPIIVLSLICLWFQTQQLFRSQTSIFINFFSFNYPFKCFRTKPIINNTSAFRCHCINAF